MGYMVKRLFDGYLIVDWSANKTPKSGKDSIWWCHLTWDDDTLVVADIRNPPTRRVAHAEIHSVLNNYLVSKKRVLVGFDFAYGYPSGFSHAVNSNSEKPWISVWEYLSEIINDDENNLNNRFAVASLINHSITGSYGPFWGCPKQNESENLSMYKPKDEYTRRFNEYRIVEQGTAAHSVWKLCYPGAVGSQVLMGLPYVHALITDTELGKVSKVWPFETGLKELIEQELKGVHIVHAEIFPSLVPVSPKKGEVKDELQVMALAHHFADLDYHHQLSYLFSGKRSLTDDERQIVEQEEGWILGV